MESVKETHGCGLLANAVKNAYSSGQMDYSIEPLVRVDDLARPIGCIKPNDSVIFCCRRGEREIELTEAFTDPLFNQFERPFLQDLNFVILTMYHEKFKDLPIAFAPSKINQTLGELVGMAGLTQFRCSESEKFAHITFFLNGGHNQPFSGETDLKIPSPKGVLFDTVPELSLQTVAEEVINGIERGYDLIITNFANGDVIGHTANTEAKVRCAEVVDQHLGQVIEAAKKNNYVVIVTADHGNIEELFTSDGKPHVAHTSNLIPFVVIDPLVETPIKSSDGSLMDIAPTILEILKVEIPEVMTGRNLVKDHDFGLERDVILIILDGWGNGLPNDTNPIYIGKTPYWNMLQKKYLPSQLKASGEAVGLQPGKAGNSEAGHMNIGAGRIVLQDDVRLDNAMQDGTFFTNEVFLQSIESVLQKKSNLHLIGLLTEKSSHGSIDYPLALLKMAKQNGVQEVYLHLIFDGRSTEPGSAPMLLEKLEKSMSDIGVGQVVSGIGRGIALDRDGNFAKIKKAYDAMVYGIGSTFT
ncbi:MAG: sulfatase-like hydrolase/transferase [Anaerolineaceae bacterium]|nr:sulfatase-like hydrolase/transferase [Anaerolineaceae bacterium]